MTIQYISVEFMKYNGSAHWHHRLRYLGEDNHGIWLGTPAGSISQRGSELRVINEHPQVRLFPRGLWWTATFNGAPSQIDIYCDVSTPPVWREGVVTMVDLDLDVIRLRADQKVQLLDEDEFANRQVQWTYPADVVRNAEYAAAWLQQAISSGLEPFARDHSTWMLRMNEELLCWTDS